MSAHGKDDDRPASKIQAGLEDALAFSQGDTSRGRIIPPTGFSIRLGCTYLDANCRVVYINQKVENLRRDENTPEVHFQGDNQIRYYVDGRPTAGHAGDKDAVPLVMMYNQNIPIIALEEITHYINHAVQLAQRWNMSVHVSCIDTTPPLSGEERMRV